MTPEPPVTEPGIEGDFCCRGCLSVAEALDTGAATGPPEAPTTDPGNAVDPTEGETAYLAVDGMHCTTCEAFLESVARGTPGVLDASASYVAGVVAVSYDPDRVDRESLPGSIDGHGYRARFVDESPDPTHDSTGRLIVGGFFGMMAMLWYALFLYPVYLGVEPSKLLFDVTGAAGTYLLANLWVMATVVLWVTGAPILRGAYTSLRTGLPNMDLLLGLATLTAYGYSVLVVFGGGIEVYFDIAVVIVLAVSLGNHYEERVRSRATARLGDLAAGRATEALRRSGGGLERVGVDRLEPGDELVVHTGDRVPVDGHLLDGPVALDESLLTGEPAPVDREAGERVVGGAVVADGPAVVEVGAPVGSAFDTLVEQLWAAKTSRHGVQRFADRVAAVFVPAVVALAVGVVVWDLSAGRPAATAMLHGLAVLVVSCPCAFGLATPLALSAAVSAGFDRGVVVADAEAFEGVPRVDVVAIDKTGTLTTGEMAVLEVFGDDRTLERAGAVEAYSAHPIAAAIAREAPSAAQEASGFERLDGRGAAASVSGETVVVGHRSVFEDRGWAIRQGLTERADRAVAEGSIPSFVGWDGRVRGLVVVGDSPRPGWERALDRLGDRVGRIVVISGDEAAESGPFGDHPAVDAVFAGVPPAGKTATVERLRAEGTVAMVGDGVNDAPALAAADIGIAMGDGADVAAGAAAVVITTDDLEGLDTAFALTAAARRRVRSNLGWALGYNAVAIPLAVSGALNPLIAAVAMAASSSLVVATSARAYRLGTPTDGSGRSRTNREPPPGVGAGTAE